LYSYNARTEDGQKQSIQNTVFQGTRVLLSPGAAGINWAANGSKMNKLNKKGGVSTINNI
jgi:hypothetical protein